MAGVNQVFSLADDIARYVKACGRSSVLQTKPIKGLRLTPAAISDTIEISLKKIPTVLNIKTNKAEQIIIDDIISIPTNGRHFDISAYNLKGDVIGLVRLKDAPNNELLRFLGKADEASLYIDFFATSPNYKGIGKEMLRKIVKISDQNGYKGRVSLSACTGSVPSEFMRICGYGKAQDVSCAIKYKKMGFNAIQPEIDTKINKAIVSGENGLVLTKSGLGEGYRDNLSCSMELSPEAISKYLGS